MQIHNWIYITGFQLQERGWGEGRGLEEEEERRRRRRCVNRRRQRDARRGSNEEFQAGKEQIPAGDNLGPRQSNAMYTYRQRRSLFCSYLFLVIHSGEAEVFLPVFSRMVHMDVIVTVIQTASSPPFPLPPSHTQRRLNYSLNFVIRLRPIRNDENWINCRGGTERLESQRVRALCPLSFCQTEGEKNRLWHFRKA